MYVSLDVFDLGFIGALVLASILIAYLKGKQMSASSNLKDAVTMLQNSHAALNTVVNNHVAAVSSLTSDADVQAAADAINAIAVQMSATANALQSK